MGPAAFWTFLVCNTQKTVGAADKKEAVYIENSRDAGAASGDSREPNVQKCLNLCAYSTTAVSSSFLFFGEKRYAPYKSSRKGIHHHHLLPALEWGAGAPRYTRRFSFEYICAFRVLFIHFTVVYNDVKRNKKGITSESTWWRVPLGLYTTSSSWERIVHI